MYQPRFEIGSRVKVPHQPQSQAVVVACYGRPEGQFDYVLRWVGPSGCITDHTFPEVALRNENAPAEEVVKAEEPHTVTIKIDADTAGVEQKLRNLRKSATRTAVAMRRVAKRKTKTQRRRGTNKSKRK